MTKLDRVIAAFQEAIIAYEDLPEKLQQIGPMNFPIGELLRDRIVFLSDVKNAVEEMKEP